MSYIKNIETLLVAVRTSRTVTHKLKTETVDPKEFKKTREQKKKEKNGLQKQSIDN